MNIAKKYVLPILWSVLMLRPMVASPVAIAADKPVLPNANAIEVWVTAYSSAPEETDDTPWTTASNKRVQDGFLAANFLPFGTQVRIPALFGDKIFTVEDRMHRRKTDFVDVWMPTKKDALKFGIHRTEIEVVHYPPIAENTANKNPAN